MKKEIDIEITLSESVLKSYSGNVDIEISVSIQSDYDIANIVIHRIDSQDSHELICEDTSIKLYTGNLAIETDVDTETFYQYFYECICTMQTGEKFIQSFSIYVVNSADEAYFNSIYTKEHLFNYIDNGSFEADDYNTRKDKCVEILNELTQKGIVENGSIYANEIGCTICYRPIGDCLHFIEYSDSMLDFSSEGHRNQYKESYSNFSKEKGLHITSNYDLLILYGFPAEENREGDYNALINHFSGEGIDDSFEQIYEEYLNTHIQFSPSLEDYECGIDNGTITIIASHGSLIGEQNTSCCHTNILFSSSDADDYHEMVAIGEKYSDGVQFSVYDRSANIYELCLLPGFFMYNYGANGLNDSVVILDNCYSGCKNDVNGYSLVDAIEQCGSWAVSGYTEKITNTYELVFNKNYIDNLYKGMTFWEAFTDASQSISEVNNLTAINVEHIFAGTNKNGKIIDAKKIPTPIVSPTNSPTPRPTATPKPTPYDHTPIDIWFMCESSDNFGANKINDFENAIEYIMTSGNYFVGKDHIGIGYCTSSGTYFSDYSQESLYLYKNIIATINNQYISGSGLLGKRISPIDWFLNTYWSAKNSRIPEQSKYFNVRPDTYYQTNYVFFVDSSTEGYINSKYVDEAVECLTENRVRVFFVNLGSTSLSDEMLAFAKNTGGGELSSSPQKMWEELLSYQGE